MLSDSHRITQIDKMFDEDIADAQFTNRLFIRLVAKEKRFTKVDFKYSIFDSCYLRNCVFDTCDFIGCRFVGSNLEGSAFPGSKFDYATFDKTAVDNDILSNGCPGHENLKMRFARTLRMNYQQLGDAKSVNKAIAVELLATEAHLHKAWKSTESYYRKKYTGFRRFQMFIEWIAFKSLDVLWGNGESALKLLRTVAIALFSISMIDAVVFRDPNLLESYRQAFVDTTQIFLGTVSSASYPRFCLTFIMVFRLFVFGLITAIIVKRGNRR
jgi:Pentapeptide repeats (9 copies)